MSETEQEIRSFLAEHQARLQALMTESGRAYWESATTGKPEAADRYARAEAEVKKLYSDREAGEQVKDWLLWSGMADPQLRRQLILLNLHYAGNQLPEETIEDLTRRAAELEQTFHTFRAELDGERVSDNHILEVLREETDNARRRRAWEASKQIAAEVAEPLRELVRRRNAAARSLGFTDYYKMMLTLQEQEETRLFSLLAEFKQQSEEPFRAVRAELDATLSERYGVAREELRPWHWEDPFSQQAPSTGGVDLDGFYEGRDIVPPIADFFRGIDLPVDDVLARSDLYEREGKSQHGFAVDIDREGDVRILVNLMHTEFWAMVLLHELGHAAYDKFIPRSLPFLLRTPAHTLTTEAIAMLMGRLARDPEWLRDNMGADLDRASEADIRRQLRLQMLVAARWIPVMVFFERELYRDPDSDRLNQLWWDLVEKWQLIRRPDGRDAPDWAAKLHLSGAPVYYHNYLLGEFTASQLTAHLRQEVLTNGGSLSGDPRVGQYLRERVFAPGASLDWNSHLLAATGSVLSPRHFIEQFVNT